MPTAEMHLSLAMAVKSAGEAAPHGFDALRTTVLRGDGLLEQRFSNVVALSLPGPTDGCTLALGNNAAIRAYEIVLIENGVDSISDWEIHATIDYSERVIAAPRVTSSAPVRLLDTSCRPATADSGVLQGLRLVRRTGAEQDASSTKGEASLVAIVDKIP